MADIASSVRAAPAASLFWHSGNQSTAFIANIRIFALTGSSVPE
jgi:hypothetical protein